MISIPKNGFFFKLLNLALRAGGMGIKFLLIVILSKYYNDSDYRDFTLILTFITLSIYALGLDFYNFSIRNILTEKKEAYIRKVLNVFLFYGAMYLLFAILFFLFFDSFDFIYKYAPLVFLLAITEHLSHEIYRLLIAFEKVFTANLFLFVRLFGWGAYILWKIYSDHTPGLQHLLAAWLFFNITTMAVILIAGMFKFQHEIRKFKPDTKWIKEGVKISLIFFLGTILLKIIEYANRFVVDYFLEDIDVGIYGFYTTIALISGVYINTIVISFELPPLIKNSVQDSRLEGFSVFKKSMLKQLIFVSVLLILLIYPLLWWQGRDEYKRFLPVFFIILAGVFLMNLSLVEHYKLYVKHKDRRILYIYFVSGIFSLISAIVFTYLWGIYGTSISFMLTGLLMFVLRTKEARKLFVTD